MTAVVIPRAQPARIDYKRFANNGDMPDAAFLTLVSDELNHVIKHHGKEVFRVVGHQCMYLNGTRNRWRFHYQSSPFSRAVAVRFTLARATAGYVFGGGGGHGDSPIATLTLTSGAFTGTATGNGPGAYTDGDEFNEYTNVVGIILGVPADALVSGVLSDTDSRLVAATVWELPLIGDNTDSGYALSNYQAGGPILATHRESVLTASNLMVRRGCSHLFNFSVDNQDVPRTTTSATNRNIIDDTSTTPSAATPGYTLDMRYKGSVASTSGKVRALFCHYGAVSTGSGGSCRLIDQAGTVLGTISGITTTAQWRTVVVDLPATQTKYDIQHATSAGTLSTYAVSCFMQLA